MKTRQGFVSNSSSTSFTFCFKGKKLKVLTDLILTKYREKFQRNFDEWHCNAMDVVRAIEGCINTTKSYDKVALVSIDKIIEDDMAYIERLEKDIKEAKEKPSTNWSGHRNYLLEDKQNLESKVNKLQKIKKNGLTTVLVIGFGDNDGEVSGGNVGYAMDYDGRSIDINAKDLVVFTEQNR